MTTWKSTKETTTSSLCCHPSSDKIICQGRKRGLPEEKVSKVSDFPDVSSARYLKGQQEGGFSNLANRFADEFVPPARSELIDELEIFGVSGSGEAHLGSPEKRVDIYSY